MNEIEKALLYPEDWIAVDECMPEDKFNGASERVLICIERGSSPVVQEMIIAHYDYYRSQWRQAWGPIESGRVVYWRPLPELPRRKV